MERIKHPSELDIDRVNVAGMWKEQKKVWELYKISSALPEKNDVIRIATIQIACVASVSVEQRAKKRGFRRFAPAKNGARALATIQSILKTKARRAAQKATKQTLEISRKNTTTNNRTMRLQKDNPRRPHVSQIFYRSQKKNEKELILRFRSD